MKSIFRKTKLVVALSAVLGVSANVQAATVSMSWWGAFTMLSPNGQFLYNSDTSSCYDPGNLAAPNQCARTAISGSLTFDTTTGAGSATIAPFSFLGSGDMVYNSVNLQAIGNGMGGPGTLMLGNMDFTWNANYGIPVSIVWDASGLFGGPLVAGASDNTAGASPIGGALMATTTWNTTPIGTPVLGTNPSGTLPLVTDTVVDATNGDIGIGGSPMVTSPFKGYNANIDVMLTVFVPAPPVPVPGAVWLFGSGLAGLVSLARRRHGVTADRLG